MRLVYCYHCMTHHSAEVMRRIETRGRTRWRCIRSIEATRKPVEARDAFGREQSRLNLTKSRTLREQVTNQRRTLAFRA